jgi:hypothetical protein
MNITKKINLLWIVFGTAALGFAAYEALARGCWGPLVGFSVGAFVGIVFARRNG